MLWDQELILCLFETKIQLGILETQLTILQKERNNKTEKSACLSL